MRFHFLGTSAGSPSIERNVTSLGFVREQHKFWDLIDCGEGTQQRILRSCLSLPKLRRIFITHLHGDHIYGLQGLLTSRKMMGGDGPLDIFGPKGIQEYLETALRCSYARNLFEITYHEFTKEGKVDEDEYHSVKSVKLSHDVPSFAYVFKEKEGHGKFDVDKARAMGIRPGPIYGELKKGNSVTLEDGTVVSGADFIGDPQPGRTVIIGGDNDSPELLFEDLKEAALFIHEATHTEATAEKLTYSLRHSTAKNVAETAQKAGTPNLILTHFSPRFTAKETPRTLPISLVQEEAESVFKGTVHLAADYDIYHLNRKSELILEESRRKGIKKGSSDGNE